MAMTYTEKPAAQKFSDGIPHVIARDEWNYTIVDLSTDAAAAVSGGAPAVLGNIFVKAALSAHACPILNGASGVFDLAASLAINSVVEWCRGMRFEDGIVVNSDNAATGTIIVMWRPI